MSVRGWNFSFESQISSLILKPIIKILVTGGSGFIGNRLLENLAEEQEHYQISVLARCSSLFSQKLLNNPQLTILRSGGSPVEINDIVKTVKPDVVIHLAAFSLLEYDLARLPSIIEANLTFGIYLLEAMSRNGVNRLINTSTFWENMDEVNVYRPLNLYAACKKAFQDIIRFYEDSTQLQAVTLKLSGTYGPHDSRPNVFSLFKKSIETAKPIAMSPGLQTMDLVYIDDVVEAYKKAIEYIIQKNTFSSEVFSIGAGRFGKKLREVARVYEECIGKSLRLQWGAVPYRPREVMSKVLNTNPAKKKLGWQVAYDLKTGIAKMLKEEGVL